MLRAGECWSAEATVGGLAGDAGGGEARPPSRDAPKEAEGGGPTGAALEA